VGENRCVTARAHAANRAVRRPRRRVAPRRGHSRVNWDRLGRVALTIVLAAVLFSYLNPVVNFIDAWRDSKAGEEQLTQLRTENEKLKRRDAEASEPAVLEREARRLGMTRLGERSYSVRGLPE
jgi:hypothetical protein